MTNQTNLLDQVAAPRSGMSICKEIFAEIIADGYQLQYKDTIRKEFIHRAITEASMTEKGAATYYQMLNKKHKEGGTGSDYPYAEAARKRKAEAKAAAAPQVFADVAAAIVADQQAEQAEDQPEEADQSEE